MKNLPRFLFSLVCLFWISMYNAEAQKIQMLTEAGEIILELYPEKAPVSVSNFLKYVDEKRLDGTVFYRVVRMDNQPVSKVKIEVIQGGLNTDTTRRFDPIVHETTKQSGLKHLDGTLSMARMGPGSASSEFFICINDQPELDFGGLRNADGQGFAAFGQVIKGMETVRKIQQGETGESQKVQLLRKPVKIVSVRRLK
ncbi:peptidylprolyl isomerase [Dyadobacter sp. NIV53]|uniref:peptidylprolyl isomerase n=1 Tax=Dyadobacter sp. NIV53 TaxID=2861765 RepID=UPI001E38D15F|nr:peptidylprolyl isomerase [Dyadobacter sp. NIV53]